METAAPDVAAPATEAPAAPARAEGVKPVDTSKWDRGESKLDKFLEDEGHVGKQRRNHPAQPKTILERRTAEKAAEEEADRNARKDPADGDETKAAPLGDRARDANGRFVAGATKTDSENAGSESSQATANEPPATATPPATKHSFAGREFESPAQAEEAFRNTEYHLDRAAQSAHAWKAEADRYRAEIDRLKAESGRGAGQPAPATGNASATPANSGQSASVDPETVAYMWKVANERAAAGDESAIGKFYQWHSDEQAKAIEAKFAARFDEFRQPYVEAQQIEQMKSTISHNWTALGQFARPDGTPLFPEVHDAQASHDIGIYLSQLGFPQDFLQTQAGLMAGIGLYRAMVGSAPQAPAASTAHVAVPPPPPSDASGVVPGNNAPLFRPGAPDDRPPEVRRLHNALELSKKPGRDLGFSR